MTPFLLKLSGIVVRGNNEGQKLGFPTANLSRSEYHRNKHNLAIGVYAGTVSIHGASTAYKAGIVVGINKIEAHLIGFDGMLYGKRISISFVKYLRKMIRFTNDQALKAQIKKDLRRVEKFIP